MDPSNAPFIFQPRRPGNAKTIAERMRDFRERHPGYDRAYKAKQRAKLKAFAEAMKSAAQAKVQAEAQAQATLEAPAVLMKIPVPTMLALPAPVADPLMLELNALKANLARAKAHAPQPVEIAAHRSNAA